MLPSVDGPWGQIIDVCFGRLSFEVGIYSMSMKIQGLPECLRGETKTN